MSAACMYVVEPGRSELLLIDRARRGDQFAFKCLIDAHRSLAFRTALFICRDRSDAEEAVQDGFLNAYRALGRFRRGAPFRPWLLRIVANEAKTRVRNQRRQLRIVAAAASDLPTHPDSTESSVLGADVRRRVLAAAEQLPAKHREVVFFRYLLDLSEGETADVLGVPPGTVKSRLSRALERLSDVVELAS